MCGVTNPAFAAVACIMLTPGTLMQLKLGERVNSRKLQLHFGGELLRGRWWGPSLCGSALQRRPLVSRRRTCRWRAERPPQSPTSLAPHS